MVLGNMDAPIKNPMQLDRPIKVTISFTDRCNLSCRYCYADCAEEPSRRELTSKQWIDLIDEYYDIGIISLLFEGGEPLTRLPSLMVILRHCAGKFLTRVRTNATLVTTEIAREFKAIGIGGVLVDVLGVQPRTHDRLTGVPGSHARTLAGITSRVEADIDTEMLIILNRHNISELQDYVELAARLGVSAVGILRLYPIGRAKARWTELALSLDEMMDALSALRPPAGLKINQSWHPRDGNTCWQMAAVNAYGDSIGCSYLRELVNFGNVLETSFMDTWDDPLYRELRSGRVTRSCGDCEQTQGSCGGCRATAFAFHGSWDAPDPFDITLNDGVDLRVLPEWMLQANPRPPDSSGT